MSLPDQIEQLVRAGEIPRQFRVSDLEPHLGEAYAPNYRRTALANFAKDTGNYVKRWSRPRFQRVGPGRYEVCDPAEKAATAPMRKETKTPDQRSRFHLRFSPQDIPGLLARYGDADRHYLAIGARSKKAGCYTKTDFVEICDWKTRGRPRRFYVKLDESVIRWQTELALSDVDEERRIRALTSLRGVRLPTASMLLHLALPDKYPVIDFRALWSLGCEAGHIGMGFWLTYVEFCRSLASECGLSSLRDLDRALWQYSKEKQQFES
jgi:hypothetical protein